MLQAVSMIAVSHEVAVTLLAETSNIEGTLDIGPTVVSLADHPSYGRMLIVESATGPSGLGFERDGFIKYSESLLSASSTETPKLVG